VQGNDILKVLPKMDYEHSRAQAELAVRRYLLLLRSQVLDSLGHPEKLEFWFVLRYSSPRLEDHKQQYKYDFFPMPVPHHQRMLLLYELDP